MYTKDALNGSPVLLWTLDINHIMKGIIFLGIQSHSTFQTILIVLIVTSQYNY